MTGGATRQTTRLQQLVHSTPATSSGPETGIPALQLATVAEIDAFDAITSDRPYRRGLSVPTATAIMRENTGPQWDPHILELFLRLVEEEGLPST